jgi:hypothetical protein
MMNDLLKGEYHLMQLYTNFRRFWDEFLGKRQKFRGYSTEMM